MEGGQLSLNAVIPSIKMVDFRDSIDNIYILDCNEFNYAVRSFDEVKILEENQDKFIAHVKGKAKMK